MNSQSSFVRGRGRGIRGQRAPQTAQPPNAWGKSRGQLTNGNGLQANNSPGVKSNSAQSLKSSKSTGSQQASVQELFEKTRSEHQQSAQRLLGSHDGVFDDSSEEEEEDIGNVLSGVFKSYASSYDNDNQREVESAQEKLLHSFRSGTSACLVCIESIKKEDSIWSCRGCYCMFHITCIQKWVREGVYTKQYATGDLHTGAASDKLPWHCPKCRHEYSQKECPTYYYCFCGKQRDPKFDPWNMPHSCGNVCGCKLVPACGHACLLLCHPGACPPCPAMVRSSCHCGASAPRMVRCSARAWACGKVCDKRLSCQQHTCQETCHTGECQPCTKTSLQKCLCGKKQTQRPCDKVSWQCDQVCGKALNCDNHVCERTCHKGPCGGCPRLGPRKCPCGKTNFTLPCTQDVPTCGDTCGKTLACGDHTCSQRCHTGACSQCMDLKMKKCRCGLKQKEILCAKEFLCEKKCPNMRNCGVHKCNRKCCEGNCPSCEQVCGKTMRCRNHKCASPCHQGPCYPCPLTANIACHCSQTQVTVPCGREKRTKPPACNLPCRAPPNCHHPARQKHRCHFGDCPTCGMVCGLKLSPCQHTCPAKCHDAVVVRIEDKRVKAGPWEERAARSQVVCKPCPPCLVPVPLECYGKHQTSDFPCSEVKPYSCGRKCGRQLSCGNHVCEKECHTVTKARDNNSAGKQCGVCERGCEVPRPTGCTHPCLRECHAPPCAPCTQRIRMRCHCQKIVKYIECHTWTRASDSEKQQLRVCEGACSKELECGHPCGMTCHSGPCLTSDQCTRTVTLRCRCRRLTKEMVCKDRDSKDPAQKLQCEHCVNVDKKPKTELESRRQEEEQRKAQQEMEEYEKMMKGRRKKQRKQQQEVVEQSLWQRHGILIVASTGLVVAAIVAFICLQHVAA